MDLITLKAVIQKDKKPMDQVKWALLVTNLSKTLIVQNLVIQTVISFILMRLKMVNSLVLIKSRPVMDSVPISLLLVDQNTFATRLME